MKIQQRSKCRQWERCKFARLHYNDNQGQTQEYLSGVTGFLANPKSNANASTTNSVPRDASSYKLI